MASSIALRVIIELRLLGYSNTDLIEFRTPLSLPTGIP